MKNQPIKTQWQYLEERFDSWRKQLYVKGKKIKASVIYSDIVVNEMTEADAVYNWDLPLEAIQEIVEYCQTHQELLRQEAQQGRELLEKAGVAIEPKHPH